MNSTGENPGTAGGPRDGPRPGGAIERGPSLALLWLYRLLFVPALLVLLPGYLRRMFRRGGFRAGFGARLGVGPPLPPRRPGVRRIWIQTVSVGELLAVEPLLAAWRADPTIEVYLTTTTTTGAALARQRHGGVLAVAYFPLDFWPCAAATWKRVQPDLLVLAEGERWPEHLYQAYRRGVPVACINARLSDRSFRRLQRVRFIARRLLAGSARLLAASAEDAARFRAVGFEAGRIEVTGNLKLDLEIPALGSGERTQLRRELGLPDGLILLGSSTWPGEEEVLADALRSARAQGVDCRLLLVPRHAERRDEIAARLRGTGFSTHFRSRGAAENPVDVSVADTTGELRRLTQLADVVFVGKSLPPHEEGQTPVEAAALEKPIVFGPGMANFREIAAGLVAAGAARRAVDAPDASRLVIELLLSPADRETMAAACRSWRAENRGAVARTLSLLAEMLPPAGSG